jgi:SAM-dependent methyltransferase
MAIQESKMQEFMGKALGDMGAAMSASLLLLGDKLGLYKAMAGAGWLAPKEIATKTGCAERYVSEWLNNQTAGGYLEYDKDTKKYRLPEEQAAALADENSPFFIPGAFQVIYAAFMGLPKMQEKFKTGGGLTWGEQHPELFAGTERFFKPNYVANLVSSWIPALEGVEAKLKKGARVADVGCGHGASTVLMAEAYPNSKITGFDNHAPSIEHCRKLAKERKLNNVDFQVAESAKFPGTGYDFVAFFDCLHDMADPVAAAKRVRESLAKDGTWMIVEPFAGDRPEENHNLVGRVYYGASTMICVPSSLAGNGPALGAQAGEQRLGDVVKSAGFSKFRRATQTPFNLVLEARP